jgi:hypothetical protein
MLLLSSALAAGALASPGVLNEGGIPYQISNPEGSTPTWKGTPGTYSTNFNENALGPVEHFDVYGEVSASLVVESVVALRALGVRHAGRAPPAPFFAVPHTYEYSRTLTKHYS